MSVSGETDSLGDVEKETDADSLWVEAGETASLGEEVGSADTLGGAEGGIDSLGDEEEEGDVDSPCVLLRDTVLRGEEQGGADTGGEEYGSMERVRRE